MRSPGGAVGMTMTEQADLSNLAYSIMEIESGDFVFLTTDGISDNYDPCVNGSAASIKTPLLIRKSNNNDTQPEMPPMLMTAYERHLYTLHRIYSSIAVNNEPICALDLCNRILQYVIRLTEEQRQIIEQCVRELDGLEGAERQKFELQIKDKVVKLPGKLDHASLVVFQIR